jgi:hypothetical protein
MGTGLQRNCRNKSIMTVIQEELLFKDMLMVYHLSSPDDPLTSFIPNIAIVTLPLVPPVQLGKTSTVNITLVVYDDSVEGDIRGLSTALSSVHFKVSRPPCARLANHNRPASDYYGGARFPLSSFPFRFIDDTPGRP